MIELDGVQWKVLVQRAKLLLLHRFTCVTSITCGSWSKPISATGYYRHEMDHTYLPGIFPTHTCRELGFEARGRIRGELILSRK